MAMKIYLAGPEVFEINPVGVGAELKKLCTKYGAEGLFPMDNQHSHLERGSIALAASVRQANMELIIASDGIIANMAPFRGPSMDVGTAYEMGVASALGKVVVAYSSNQKNYFEKVKEAHKLEMHADGHFRDENGMSVEDFKDGNTGGLIDNLMMACGTDGPLCSTAEEAIKMAVELYNSKHGVSA